MTTKHTPGPWTYFKQHKTGKRVLDIETAGNSPATERIASLPFCGDESEANARLIAAAPELLAAAEEALKCIEKHIPATVFAPRMWLREAIKKATQP